jgi:phosphatidylglycerol:prolipoprotein diacylglycerol transferase
MLAIAFPVIDPVLIEIGPFALRWYALAYIGGILLAGCWRGGWMALLPVAASREQVDDFVTWTTLGIILGGRLGYVLFYRPGYYITAPWEALYVWQGGMSFHGGMLGVVLAALWFCRRQGLRPLRFGDRVAPVVPIGLGLGRLANFINGELWGRVTDVPWAMVFPTGGPEPRHPSQLYQAAMEGMLLFVVLNILVRIPVSGSGRASSPVPSWQATAWRAWWASSSASPMRISASCSPARPWGSCCRCR